MENQQRTNTFNDEGRIPQIEFAIKNVSKAGTALAYRCTDGIVLIGLSKSTSDHIEKRIEKIYKINEHIYCVLAGLFADGLQIISLARQYAQNYLYDFGIDIPLQHLVKQICLNLQYFTHGGGMRPFGVSFIFASITENLIISTDPAGSSNGWKAKAFGMKEDAINNALQNLSDKELNLDQGILECFKTLAIKQEITETDAGSYEVLCITEKKKYFLDEDKIKDVIVNAKESIISNKLF